MAISLRSVLIPIFIYSILLLSHTVKCDPDEEDLLLQSINSYRLSLNLTALVKNQNAECLADEVAEQFQHQPCTNSTGPNTVLGTEPQFGNYPTLLAKCHLNVSNTRDGIVLPACVPNLETSLVVSNFTRSQYSDYINDTKFTGVGIGHEDNWIVVVLTTSTPEGSFAPAQGTVGTGNAINLADMDDDLDDLNDDHDDIHDDRKDRDDLDDNDDHKDRSNDHNGDEEDILLQAINAHRATSRVSLLIETKAADCFADEYADRFQDQLCSNTTGSIAAPGTITNISSYTDILFKCSLNVLEGIVLPACAPYKSPSTVLTSLKSSQYASSLDDPKYTGVGIGSEDDWLVVVLTSTTNTRPGVQGIGPAGTTPNTPNPFNEVHAVDGVNAVNKASLIPKMSFVHHFLLLLVASVFLL